MLSYSRALFTRKQRQGRERRKSRILRIVILEELDCGICHATMHIAVASQECGHAVCFTCIESWFDVLDDKYLQTDKEDEDFSE